jgi:hypothetical protein
VSKRPRARGVYLSLAVLILLSFVWLPSALTAQSSTGGFLESALTTVTRPILTGSAVSTFLPSRGQFTFPAPYSTLGVRLTNSSDCGGTDCVLSVGYSYWRNINNHVSSNRMLVMLTLYKSRGGPGPSLFSYDKTTGATQNLGPIFDAGSALSWASGEGWYFSATLPNALYVNDGPRLLRYDVVSRASTTIFDITNLAGPNRSIWQIHSSNDDAVHSFTVKDASTTADLGCGVYFERTGQYKFFPARGTYDECQIEKSGRYLVIKEDADGRNAEDNVVEDLSTGAEWILSDEGGALGHGDMGFGYSIGEDNWYNAPGNVRLWQYGPNGITNGRLVYQVTSWNFNSSHIAHSNARTDVPIEQQFACNSNASRLVLTHANEVVCYRLDGSLQVLVVAPVMTDLNASGGGDDYTKMPKGNLDVTGQYMVWTSNMGTSRQDAFIVRVPLDKLGVTPNTGGTTPSPTPDPTPTPTPDPTPTPTPEPAPTPTPTSTFSVVPVTWINQVKTSVSGDTLSKRGGCNGCQDAGATSSQQIASGDGYFEFTATDVNYYRVAGLSKGNLGTSMGEIHYGLRLARGIAEVRESGTYRADATFATGDVFRIQITAGVVSYQKNGTTFYTSTKAPSYPLLVDTSIIDKNATIKGAKLGTTGSTSTTTPTPAPATFSWGSLLNVEASASAIKKVSGCDGCPDAGAVSEQSIASGNGYVEFSIGSSGMQFVGLNTSSTLTPGMSLPFSLRLNGIYAEVRESGAYRSDVTAAPGDTLRIAVTNGKVVYSKGGVAFYTSAITPTYPLRVHASMYSIGAVLNTPTFQGQ